MLFPFCFAARGEKQALAPEVRDSLQHIVELAEQGDAAAQNSVGVWYYNGEHYDRDYAKAVQWWLRALKQENAGAAANLAKCYLRGHGVEVDSTRAAGLVRRAIRLGSRATLQEYTERADEGDLWSARLLADIYKRGLKNGDEVVVPRNNELYGKYLGVIADATQDEEQMLSHGKALLNAGKYDEALEQYLPLADRGNPSACFWAGKILLEGKDVEPDKERGIEYLTRAAEGGFPMADYYLGRSYSIGDGVVQNPSLAVKWYRKAAEGGNHYGLYFLGRALATGEGTQPRFAEALRMLERAAAKGHKLAFTKLINDTIPDSPFATYVRGMKLMRGGAYAQAMNQFRKLERTNKDEARTMEGLIYCTQAYSDYNLKKGISLLKSSAKAGEPVALYNLGLFNLDGTGMKKNVAEGVKLLEQAAEAGSGQAALALASLYASGKGVEKDEVRAAELRAKVEHLMPAASKDDLLPALLKTIVVTE